MDHRPALSQRAAELFARLASPSALDAIEPDSPATHSAIAAFARSGVGFVASDPRMEHRHQQAVRELISCIKPTGDAAPILNEGGIYLGCWLESTGTISAELLSRFVPTVAADTFARFAKHQRGDGLFPYKLTEKGPVFSQIQTVTPLARSVWTHFCLNGQDEDWLARMYVAMARNDAWLAQWRDTRGTGAVEAFCTYDTGHDLSARFWHIPDSPAHNDPKLYRRDNPVLPLIAPDLTANIACQREYLALMAERLGEDGTLWRDKAARSREALFAQCFDAADHFFYDRDRNDQLVRVQSDVLLRVLACEIGDGAFFETALERYLLNTRKFFAKYPFTSLALDDPRFDPAFDDNSWCGPTNVLSLIRAPHAFEHHGRHVELSWMMQPILSALFRADRFAQTISPFTGAQGFTEIYSPSILCLLDFVERLSGVLPRPDGTLWFTALVPAQMDGRDQTHAIGYSRTVDGARFCWVNDGDTATAWRDGQWLFSVPQGVRVATDRLCTPQALTGMSASPVSGLFQTSQGEVPLRLGPNEEMVLVDGQLRPHRPSRLTVPRS